MLNKKSATIHDIARQAGVSPSTVSRVLNGTTPVAPDKHAAIMAAIQELHYSPNVVAQSLVRGRSNAIGVVTQDVASPFYGSILLGIDQGLLGSSYHPIFSNANWNPKEELKAFDMILNRRVDGLILLGGLLPDDKLCEVAEEIPVLAVGR